MANIIPFHKKNDKELTSLITPNIWQYVGDNNLQKFV